MANVPFVFIAFKTFIERSSSSSSSPLRNQLGLTLDPPQHQCKIQTAKTSFSTALFKQNKFTPYMAR